MKKKKILAMLLACSMIFGTASMTACNLIGSNGENEEQGQQQPQTVAVTGVSLDETTVNLKVGNQKKLTATVAPSDATNKSVTWASDNPDVASVDVYGNITAKAKGTAVITVTTVSGGKTDSCTVNVSENEPEKVSVKSVKLNKNSVTLKVDGTEKLTVSFTPANPDNKNVSWSSNKTNIATVSTDGLITAKAAGTATITVTSEDGSHTDTCTVTVEAASVPIPTPVKVTGVTLNTTSATLKPGETVTLKETVSPADAENKAVTWQSGNTSVATVSNNGVVTAVAAGQATITVKTVDGNFSKTCTVTVEQPSVKPVDPVVDKKITYSYAGNECAAFEWGDANAAGADVEYKLSTANTYTKLSGNDKQFLIRQVNSTTARVDLVGLKGGAVYDFKITTSGKEVLTAEDVTIHSYDRSGYAHFKKTDGVGAYKDDGTPKSNAVIVYVNEDNKNTVTANGQTGLVKILQNASASKPLIVRIVGTVGSATWNELTYSDASSASNIKGINNKQLPTSSNQLTQKYLSENGYNTLNYTPNDPFYNARTPDANGATCTVLSGIEEMSKAIYSSSKVEYDSCWNNVSLSGRENVTVEGIGEDARIFQWGFTWGSCNSIEVRNIKFDDYTEDACSFESGDFNSGNGNYWVHHNKFEQGKNYWDVCPEQDKHEGDGATDFKRVKNITIAYNHYYKNHKTGLIGSDDSCLTANVTFHHNYYEKNSSRMPLGRQANMHMYNNYYLGSTGTNMSLRGNAFALIENCYFENANVPIELKSGGVAKVLGSVFTGKQPSANDNLHIDTNESNLKRESQVTNNNTVVGSGKYFDIDTSLFYYDSANKKSNVSVMFTAQQTKEYVPELAGVQKRGGNVNLGGAGGSGSGTGTENPNPNPDPGDETGETQTIVVIDNFKAANGLKTYTFEPSADTAKYFDSTKIYLYTTSDDKNFNCTDTYVKVQAANKIKFVTTSQVPAGAKIVLTMDSTNQATAVMVNDAGVNVVNGTVTFDLASGTEYILGRAGGETRIASISIIIPA